MVSMGILAILLVFIGSIMPELLLTGLPAASVQIGKLAVLLAAAALCRIVKKWRGLWRFALVLLVINASFLFTGAIRDTRWWSALFSWAGFFRGIAGNVAVKAIGLVPVAAALLLLLGGPRKAYLKPGDLSRKADTISWLGIRGDVLPWGRLAVISGLLIMLGTALLTVLTTIGFRAPGGGGRWLSSLPLILLLAVVNSFCEGLVFRSAIMGPLRETFEKGFMLFIPALYFGIAHYQGVPGGPLGAVMSGALGYYMSRSMAETGGFASAWIIHCLQDVAIFSTLALLM